MRCCFRPPTSCIADMDRRAALRSLALAPIALRAGTLFAAPATTPRLLVAFLRGGYDCASLLVPTSSAFYYESRPSIAIAQPGEAPECALALDADWGLHPALRETLWPLYQRKQLAFIPFAGTEDVSRSHFETQDSIELGQPLGGTRNYQSGFLNRLVATLNGASGMSFTDPLPLVFRGRVTVPNMALRAFAKPGIDAHERGLIEAMYSGTPLAGVVAQGFAVREEVMRDMSAEMQAADRNAISTRGFEAEARRIARLMKERYAVGFVDVGGWDTHVGQGNATGYLANRLEELGRGLAAFAAEMGTSWADTVVVVMSEFGRTFRENGNRGTDHGHGSVYWVLGGAVDGGRIAGEQRALDRGALFQDRDYPVLNEYRALMAGLLARMYSFGDKRIQQVFPGAKPRELRLI